MVKKILLFGLCILLIPIVLAGYVKDHNDCPTTYQSQDCLAGENVCAYVSSTVYCDVPATVNSTIPSSVTQTSSDNYDASLGGGYVYNCYYSSNSNCNTWQCQRNASCYTVNRKTNCSADSTSFVCDTCITGYIYCNGSWTDGDGCEIQTDVTNCPAGANNHYNSTCGCSCDTNYLDCDGGGANATNGCEIQDSGTCTVGSLSGTYSGCIGSAGNCVIDKSYFETGTLIKYLTNATQNFLWGYDYGSGGLINFTNSKNESFIVDNETNVITTGDITADYFIGYGTNVNTINATNITTKNINATGNITMSDDQWIGIDPVSGGAIIFDKDREDIELVGGTVCIGTSTPSGAYVLYVKGDSYFVDDVTIATDFMVNNVARVAKLIVKQAGTTPSISDNDAFITGNTGLGMLPSTSRLHVNGTINATNITTNYLNINSIYADPGLIVKSEDSNSDIDLVDATSSIRLENKDGKFIVYTYGTTSEKMRITRDGEFGIGTKNPAYLLQTGTISSGKDVNLSGVIYVNGSSGNVGIGTTTPNERLTVVGNQNITGGLNVSGLNSTFFNDVVIEGTLHGGSPVKIAGINISNNVFMLKENRNSSSRFTLQNLNNNENATAVISTINDVGGSMSIGIGSSNFMIGNKNYQNITALFSKSRGDMIFANFYKKAFTWLYNPSDDNDADNLVEIMKVNEDGLNLSVGSIYLGDFETSVAGGAKVVKRSNANGALFGISNPIAGANPTSGAGYVSIQDCGNYTVDAHSSLDTNNPNGVVHHLRGCITTEDWRLNPNNESSSFEFESSVNSPILKINKSGVIVFRNLTIGSPISISNITMFTNPSGNPACCGVMDDYSWGCTSGVCV